MARLADIAEKVQNGETVSFRPTGDSMTPRIKSRQRVTVQPVKYPDFGVGDIVLCRVKGVVRLHLIVATEPGKHRALIGNNHGHLNGWTSYDRIYGKCVKVED